MKIQLQNRCPFDLDLTLCCGQTFRWDKEDEWWRGIVKGNVVKIRQDGKTVEFEGAGSDLVVSYFGLNDNLPMILAQINKDEHIAAAIVHFKGLRILRQDPWECLISYICATYKNIASIKRMLKQLSKRFGEEIEAENQVFHVFPTPEKLAMASLTDLKRCELGYRARFVSKTSKKIFETNHDLHDLETISYSDARGTLLKFSGVGQKVADCVLLFGLRKLEAFPIDVWIRRSLIRHYATHFPREFVRKISKDKSLSNSEYMQLNLFGRQYFGTYAGYAQEYLYHCERMSADKSGNQTRKICL